MKKIKRLISWVVFIFTFRGEIREEAEKDGLIK